MIMIPKGFSLDPIRLFFLFFILTVLDCVYVPVWLRYLYIVFFKKDRPTDLIPKLKGVLTNPNCEFYPNFVAVHTLATWCKAPAEGAPRDVEMGEFLLVMI